MRGWLVSTNRCILLWYSLQERAHFPAPHRYSGPKHSTLSGGVLFCVWTCPEKPDFMPVTGFLCSHDTEPNNAQKANTRQFYEAFYRTLGLRCMPANTRYRPLCPLDMLRHSPHCLAHYKAIMGAPARCCRLIISGPCMGRSGRLYNYWHPLDGQLINTTYKAVNLYARPCLHGLSPRPIVRSIPADLRALFGVKAAENQEYLILIQVVKFMWLRCICADKWLYTAVYLYFW